MFYSHSVEDSKFNLFTSLISTLIDGKNEYKNFVDCVIQDSADLVNNHKTMYELSRDTFPIAVYLADQDPDFFKAIDAKGKEVGVDEYRHVYEILRKENVQVSYC